jgi:FkbM family methyltransferase
MIIKKILKPLANSLVIPFLNRRSLSMSQAGQDLWVYGEVFNEKKGGFFLDIGAHDGVYLSNTFLLEKRFGWNGICIEGNPATFRDLKRNRQVTCVNACIDSEEKDVEFVLDGVNGGILSKDCDNREGAGNSIKVKTRSLVNVLIANNAPPIIDYLSIDVEGAEDRVLLGFPFEKYQFQCITIERPSPQLQALLGENHYVLIKKIPGLDCFYIHESLMNKDEYHNNTVSFWKKHYLIKRWR